MESRSSLRLHMMMAWLWLLLLCIWSSHGLDVIEKDHTVDKGPKLEAAKALTKKIESDYGYQDPPKTQPDKTHFEYNISFYADADHFEEDPVSLEKELNQIILHLDDWVESLREPTFSVKLRYKLKVFKSKDPDRIDYNTKVSTLHARDVWDVMKKNKLVKDDPGHILLVLIPYRPDQKVTSGSSAHPGDQIRGVASPMEFRELGLGLSMVYTRKWAKEDVLIKQGTDGYKWRHERWLCLAKKTCTMKVTGGPPEPENAPKYTFEMDVMTDAVTAGKEQAPTMELVDAHLARNITGHQKTWIGVTAHEVGHLLGAAERGAIQGEDEAKIMWDVMLNPIAGTRYGDTSKYGIFLNIACEIRLKDSAYTPQLNIHSRTCKVPGGESSYYRRFPSAYVNVEKEDSKKGLTNGSTPVRSDNSGSSPMRSGNSEGTPMRSDNHGSSPLRSGNSGGTPMRSDNRVSMPTSSGGQLPARHNNQGGTPMRSDNSGNIPVSSQDSSGSMPMRNDNIGGMQRRYDFRGDIPMSSMDSSMGMPMNSMDSSGSMPMSSMDISGGMPMRSIYSSGGMPLSSMDSSGNMPMNSMPVPFVMSNSNSNGANMRGNGNTFREYNGPESRNNYNQGHTNNMQRGADYSDINGDSTVPRSHAIAMPRSRAKKVPGRNGKKISFQDSNNSQVHRNNKQSGADYSDNPLPVGDVPPGSQPKKAPNKIAAREVSHTKTDTNVVKNHNLGKNRHFGRTKGHSTGGKGSQTFIVELNDEKNGKTEKVLLGLSKD